MTTNQKNNALSTMKENIEWLKFMEEGAAELYTQAARFLTDDKELQELFLCLKEDEEEHTRLMALALSVYKDTPSLTVPFEIDEDIKDKHMAVAKRILKMVADGTLTGYAMLDAAIELEYAELNGLFIYVTESLKDSSKEFVNFGVEIEKHKKSIERFIRSRPEYELLAKKIPALPKLSNERILVVDKSEPLVKLMEVILSKEGQVHGTANGEEALKRIKEEFFNLIITDIEVMGMNGIELYKSALKEDAHIKDRILFLTSNDDKEHLKFFRDEGVRYLVKPAPIKEIVGHSIDILKKRRHI